MKHLLLGSVTMAALLVGAVANAGVGVPFQDIADGLSAPDFRDYGVSSPAKVTTRLGDLSFTAGGFAGGYPDQKTVDLLQAELNFQKAVQAYIWAVPLVS